MSNIQTLQLTQANTSNSSNSQLKMNFPFPFSSQDNEIALSNAFIYYSWRNITSVYGNNTCRYTFNGSNFNVTFPDGFYSYSDINGYLQSVMKTNGHYLLDANSNPVYYISIASNTVYYSVTLTCSVIPSSLPTNWTNPAGITLSGNCPLFTVLTSQFGTILGFNVNTYPSVTQATQYQINSSVVPQISPVTSINLNCNFVNNSKFNTLSPQCIYTFSPNVEYSSQIIIQPQTMLWFKILDQNYSYIDIQFKDQNGNNLQVLDNNIVVTLLVRNSKNY